MGPAKHQRLVILVIGLESLPLCEGIWNTLLEIRNCLKQSLRFIMEVRFAVAPCN